MMDIFILYLQFVRFQIGSDLNTKYTGCFIKIVFKLNPEEKHTCWQK